jgi:uridine kinase
MIQTFTWLVEQTLEKAQNQPFVIAVDGRSSSGKTTFAKTLAHALGAPTVHTDDVAWHHSFFDWWPLLIDHILLPFKAGQAVNWTPEAWTAKGRKGAVVVPAAPILVVEGVSSSRLELNDSIDLAIWIETDAQVAQRRGLERDGPQGFDFWFEWQASEIPFLERDKPWERADLIVDGAPTAQIDLTTQFVIIQK